MLNGIVIPCSESEIASFCSNALQQNTLKNQALPEKWKTDLSSLGEWSYRILDYTSPPFEYYISLCHSDIEGIFVFNECATVMDIIPDLAGKNLSGEWGSVISVSQSGGRGRFGRKWVSGSGNLHAAVLLPDLPDDFSMLAGMMVSVIIIEYLRSSGINTMLKWPNDIVLDGRKIAGVLVENKKNGCIAGIGMNLAEVPDESELRGGFLFPAGTIPEIPGKGPLKIWIDLVRLFMKRFHEVLSFLKLPGFISIADEMLLWKGEMVAVSDTADGEITGIVSGIGVTGGLRILGSYGEKEIFSGTVIRKNNN